MNITNLLDTVSIMIKEIEGHIKEENYLMKSSKTLSITFSVLHVVGCISMNISSDWFRIAMALSTSDKEPVYNYIHISPIKYTVPEKRNDSHTYRTTALNSEIDRFKSIHKACVYNFKDSYRNPLPMDSEFQYNNGACTNIEKVREFISQRLKVYSAISSIVTKYNVNITTMISTHSNHQSPTLVGNSLIIPVNPNRKLEDIKRFIESLYMPPLGLILLYKNSAHSERLVLEETYHIKHIKIHNKDIYRLTVLVNINTSNTLSTKTYYIDGTSNTLLSEDSMLIQSFSAKLALIQ